MSTPTPDPHDRLIAALERLTTDVRRVRTDLVTLGQHLGRASEQATSAEQALKQRRERRDPGD